jgi:hypothetical protein
MEQMTKEEAVKKVAELVHAACASLGAAENLADEFGLEFYFSPAYGMGGRYVGETSEDSYGEPGWNPSSMSC